MKNQRGICRKFVGEFFRRTTTCWFRILKDRKKCKKKQQWMIECISRGIIELGKEDNIIIVGDMKAHIEDLDEYTDSTGGSLFGNM